MRDYSEIIDFLQDNRQCLIHNNFDGLFEAFMEDPPSEFYFGEVIDFFLDELKINILNYFSFIPSNGMFLGSQSTTLDFSKNTKIYGIPSQCFQGLSKLDSVILPPKVTFVGNEAFYGCDSLTSIKIPSSVKSIGDRAFCWCKTLSNIMIPYGVTNIGDYAFGCSRLTNITIPESVTSIGKDAFYICSPDLVIYTKAGSYAEQYAKENKISVVIK